MDLIFRLYKGEKECPFENTVENRIKRFCWDQERRISANPQRCIDIFRTMKRSDFPQFFKVHTIPEGSIAVYLWLNAIWRSHNPYSDGLPTNEYFGI